MKKRILFVDDETLVLQGLQRMLRPMREDWEMEFIDSGAKALRRMAEAPFDVVVSDMRMPGMNGAELLAQVMKLYPKTVRLILSGHADKDLILKCVGSTHQFLAKPCDADALKATVLRASGLENSLNNARVQQLICQMDQLPSIPALYTEIVEKLNNPDVALEEVGQIIARDIGMTAKILKLVNSAFFGLRRQVASPQEAVIYLGLDTIKSLVLSLNTFSQFDHVKVGGLTVDTLWRHGLNIANLAKQIAQLENADGKVRDESFVAGMLHDIGKLILAANLPAEYARVLELAKAERLELFTAEEQLLGANHADAGGYLLGLWGLPVPIVEAIALHHCPARCAQQAFSPLTAVHAANALDGTLNPTDNQLMRPQPDLTYLANTGFTEHFVGWREALAQSPIQEQIA